MDNDRFFEEDEPVEEVLRAFERGPHGITVDPRWSATGTRSWSFTARWLTTPTAAVATGFHPQGDIGQAHAAASLA